MNKRIAGAVVALLVFLAGVPVAARPVTEVQLSVREQLVGTWEHVRMENIYLPEPTAPGEAVGRPVRTIYYADGSGRTEMLFQYGHARQTMWLYFDWEITPPNILRLTARPHPELEIVELAEYAELVFMVTCPSPSL